MKNKNPLFILFTLVLFFSFTFNISANQPSGNVSKPNPLSNTYFGDIDGDGLDDIVQFSKNRIFSVKNNFQRDGILHAYLDANIKRLVLGDFTTSGREHGRVQVLTIMENGTIRVYSSSDDNRTLWWWFTQDSFIADDEEAIVGDFSGNGADDILVYNPSKGTLRLYVRNAGNTYFVQESNFSLGNLADFNLRNKRIYTGDFGQTRFRADLLIVDPTNGQISRYDSVTDSGKIKFWWAFSTDRGFLNRNQILNVGNIEGGVRDGVVISRGNNYKFYRLQFNAGGLHELSNISIGSLSGHSRITPIMGHFSAFNGEQGHRRDDLMLFHRRNRQFIQMDARYDPNANQPTFWWAYTKDIPKYHEGWPDRVTDKWLVTRCRLSDYPNTSPKNQAYFENLFTKNGSGKMGMYNYFHNLSYGALALDTEVANGWKTTTQNSNNAKGNGFHFRLWGPVPDGHGKYYDFELEFKGRNTFFLKHLESGKYLSSSASNNGGTFWTWAPIPAGHDAFYLFSRIDQGNGEYYLRHEHSGKFIASGDTGNDGRLVMWGPIPVGHEDRYTFKFIDKGNGKFHIWHKLSGKFISKTFQGGRYDLTTWCAGSHGYTDLDEYKGLLSIYNVGGDDIGASGNRVNLNMDFWHQNVIAHEMMHVYGLGHSFDDSSMKLETWASPGEYFDPYDVEGSTPDTARFAGEFGSSGAGLHAVNKDKLGWLPVQRIKTLPLRFSSPVDIQIAALERPESNGFLSLIIELANNEKLAIELREDSDWDQAFGATAVYIRKLAKHPNNNSQVTYLQTQGDGPQFLVGEQFTGSGVSINVKGIDVINGTATLSISK